MDLKDLQPAIMVFILVGLILGIGLTVLGAMSNNVLSPTSTAGQNDTVWNLNSTSGKVISTATSCAITTTALINATGGETINPGNYTISGCTITAATATYNNTNVNSTTTFSWLAATAASNSITATITGIATLPAWISIIITVLAAAVILGIVLHSFSGRRD